MKNILVSGASGIVGYGILKALRSSGLELNLIGTTIYEDSAAQGFCDIFEQAIPTNDPGYIKWLCDVIEKHSVDFLLPGIEADMYSWADHIDILESKGAKVLMNNLSLMALCKDKWSFYEYLISNGASCAIESSLSSDFEQLASQFGVPFLLKPRRGFGSKGIVRVRDLAEFQPNRELMGTTLMAQPIVGSDDEEYTTSAFCDGQGGYYAFMTLRRKLSKDGFTDKAEVIDLPGVESVLKELCQIFLPEGPTNFQFRSQGGQLRLLEINPRISSATSIRTAFGYNESKMAVEYYLENKIPAQPKIRKGKAVRYTEDMIYFT